MATLSIQIVSALGTNNTTLTFSGPDATRIFTAWKNRAGPKDSNGVANGTQAQFVTYLAAQVQNIVNNFITVNEQTAVISPPMTVTIS